MRRLLGYQVLGPKPGVGPGSDTPASPQQETVPPAATGPGYADENVDLAKAMVDLQLQEVAYQASLATTARVLQPSLIDFLR